jgi:hypothetical protein
MRATLHSLLVYGAWLGTVEALTPSPVTDATGRAAALAGMLGTLTVLVYRLGVWRQEMESMKHDVGADVKAHRDESAASFARIDRRLEAIDHMITMSSERRVRAARWQARTSRRIAQLERGNAERER